MDLLASLRSESRPPRLYRLRLGPAHLEQEFRNWQRRRHAPARALLFAVLALGYGITPLFNVRLFNVPEDVLPALQTIQWLLVLPMAAAGALASFAPDPRVQRTVQACAAASIWAGTLAMRGLALHHGFDFPSQMLGMVMVAVAFFGGFRWTAILGGTLIGTALAIAVEYRGAAPGSNPGLQTFGLATMALIAVAGTYTHELLARLVWLNKRYAETLAATDGLTGLANHHDFHRSLERVLALAAREQRQVAVALLDLDHFKSINDRYGHLFGDRVLRRIGALLGAEVAKRPLDLRARYGGEEMAIVWYDVKAEALPGLIEGLLDEIRKLPFADPAGGLRVRVTASAGLAWLVPDEQTRAEDVLHYADILLYCAKSEGRDRARLAPYGSGLQTLVHMPSAANGLALRRHAPDFAE
ncbi:GGDEF domain-containing protein [Solimonas flava]|uniref:GGDEF domain-containing protein n=1 Tax=Solimonas flava TaxID=415849 RepID=UPI000416E4A2|nr:GGDEF domain-containing protein [Solimonas flava]